MTGPVRGGLGLGLGLSGAPVLEVRLLDAPAEGQQVAVALDPLAQLAAGQPGGQDGEEVTEDQRVQLCGPSTHRLIRTRFCPEPQEIKLLLCFLFVCSYRCRLYFCVSDFTESVF